MPRDVRMAVPIVKCCGLAMRQKGAILGGGDQVLGLVHRGIYMQQI